MTADISRSNGQVRWSRLGWNNSYDPETDQIENAVEFVFDEADYERVLLGARTRLVDEQPR